MLAYDTSRKDSGSLTTAKSRSHAVLSLYEGMIERHGLNPFRPPAPEHARGAVFSSLGARAPVALQRTFVLPRAVSALGVTVTKRGIASKHFLAATSAGQILALAATRLLLVAVKGPILTQHDISPQARSSRSTGGSLTRAGPRRPSRARRRRGRTVAPTPSVPRGSRHTRPT